MEEHVAEVKEQVQATRSADLARRITEKTAA